jgi:Type II secretion system (T2SS), protein E, N-terminal domain
MVYAGTPWCVPSTRGRSMSSRIEPMRIVVPGQSLGPEFDELGRQFQVPPIDVRRMVVAPEILAQVPPELAHQYEILPVAVANDGTLIVASAEPSRAWGDDLSADLGVRVEFVVSPRGILIDAIRRYYPSIGV